MLIERGEPHPQGSLRRKAGERTEPPAARKPSRREEEDDEDEEKEDYADFNEPDIEDGADDDDEQPPVPAPAPRAKGRLMEEEPVPPRPTQTLQDTTAAPSNAQGADASLMENKAKLDEILKKYGLR
jgi:hypothetical protein